MEGVESISNHITSLYAAKMIAFTKKNEQAYFNINLEQESEKGAIYIHNSRPGVSVTDGPNYERKIDEKYLNTSMGEKSFRMVII
jgi:glutamate dehydrogenase